MLRHRNARFAPEWLERKLSPGSVLPSVAAQVSLRDDPEPLPSPNQPSAPLPVPPPPPPVPILPYVRFV
jgi:hypothetical protein